MRVFTNLTPPGYHPTTKQVSTIGTNYYWHMGRKKRETPEHGIHVGKRSGGWSFGFRAWREGFIHPAFDIEINGVLRHFPESKHEPSPFESLIESRADWCRKVFTAPGILVSEYHEECPDVLEWLRVMEPPTEAQIAKESLPYYRGDYDYPSRYGAGPRKGEPMEWRDAEGFRFLDCEFF